MTLKKVMVNGVVMTAVVVHGVAPVQHEEYDQPQPHPGLTVHHVATACGVWKSKGRGRGYEQVLQRLLCCAKK